MRVGDFLEESGQPPITCTPDETVEAVAQRLSRYNIGAMPVRGAGDALVGVISGRDLVHGFARDSEHFRARRVRDLMSREVITCGPGESMAAAEKLMNEHHIRHLPVVERSRLVGVVSMRDAVARAT